MASPAAKGPFIEDLVRDTEQLALFGPRGGLPTGVRNDLRGGRELVQFGDDEIEENLGRWERRATTLAAGAGVAHVPRLPIADAVVDGGARQRVHSGGFRINTKGPPKEVRGKPEEAAAPAGVFDEDVAEPFDASEWVALEERGGLAIGDDIPKTASSLAVHEDRAIVRLSSGTVVGAGRRDSLSTPRVVKQDLRTLGVQYQMADGVRSRIYVDAVKLITETPFGDWKISGPRTTRWLLRSIASQGFGPVQRHYWWRSVQHLSSADLFVDDHLFISELLETTVCFDQLNASELGAMELVARRYQLYEEFYSHSLRQSDGGQSAEIWMDERQLFLGQERGRGKALACPLLEEWVAERLKSESAVLKERRKGREERMLSSANDVVTPAEVAAAQAKATGRGRGRGRV